MQAPSHLSAAHGFEVVEWLLFRHLEQAPGLATAVPGRAPVTATLASGQG